MGKVRLSPWNSADPLKSDENMALYLDACLEDGDPALITHALSVIARVRGMTQLAYDMEATGEGGPAFAVVLSAIGVLGFRLQAEQDHRRRWQGTPLPCRSPVVLIRSDTGRFVAVLQILTFPFRLSRTF